MRKLLILAVPLLVGCATAGPPSAPPSPLINALGAPIGTVRAWQTAGGVMFRIDAGGLPQGTHGIHVHAIGRCDPPEFTSAGAHWNPTDRKHGMNNPAGPHGGDLPNVEVAPNGVLAATLVLPGASLFGPGALMDADGAALVLHAKADDNVTDPSGNSGARIACAVIRPPAGMP